MIIGSFSGQYRFLSNFWPCSIKWEGSEWKSSEHIYQAMKTLDQSQRTYIRNLGTPGEAKRVGAEIILRPDWNKVKFATMSNIVTVKFCQNPELMEKLKETGDAELVEGNTWGDTYWGQCPIGNGKNQLGKILMEIRDGVFG